MKICFTVCNGAGRGKLAKIGAVRREVKKAYRELRNWRKVGARFGITGGMAWRIAVQGYEPRQARIRARLGLAAYGQAPVCESCGEVHVSKRCVKGRGRKKIMDGGEPCFGARTL